MQNLSKWVNLSFLICSVLAWALLREVFVLVFDPLGWNRMNWLIAPSDIGGIVSGAGLFVYLWRNPKAAQFAESAITELAKVTWPNRKETALSTGVVAVMVGIATLCVLFFDTIWAWVAETVLYF